MAIKDELREQFDFFKRQSYETKKEYKRRIMARGQELFDGKNCTLEDFIRFKALYNCRSHIIIMHFGGKCMVFGDINSEEYALRKGTAKDYEKYVDLIFFERLDEKKFQSEKERLYDEFIVKCNKSQFYSDEFYYDYGYNKLLNDEYLERLYANEVSGKIIEKKRKYYNK